MNRSRIGRIVPVTIAVVLLVVVGAVVSLSAQGNPTLNQILAKLDEIIATLTPPAGSVKLASAPVLIASGTQVYCLVANVGTESLEIFAQFVAEHGDPIGSNEGPLAVPPGESNFRSVDPGESTLLARCEITFDGPATAVRTHVEVVTPQGVSFADMR
jgi:hypothetical protein